MAQALKMPQLGESIFEGTILAWLKAEGDSVALYDPLLEVETDKVTTEVTSPYAGVLLKILLPVGTVAKAGDVLAWVGAADEVLDMPASPEIAPAPPAVAEKATPPSISPVAARMAAEHALDIGQMRGSGSGGRITKRDVQQALMPPPPVLRDDSTPFLSPIVSRLLTEHGLEAQAIQGTGKNGRITKQDVLKALQSGRPTDPRPVPSAPPVAANTAGQRLPVSAMRRSIAEHMLRSVQTSPHVTTVMQADLSRVVGHREAHKAEFGARGLHLSYTPYFIMASAQALRRFPIVNSQWEGETIFIHEAIHIGLAVSLGQEGLLVPVIRHADEKNLAGLAREVADLAERGRTRRLNPDELVGGTFSISNHGTNGSLFATPLIVQPQCAILGVGKIEKRALVVEDMLALRPCAYLSLTFDHRLIDGDTADSFLSAIKDHLETWSSNS